MEPAVSCPEGHYLATDGKCYPNQPPAAPAPAPEPEVIATEEVAVGGRRRGRKQRKSTRKQRKGTRKQRKQRKSRKQQRKQQRKH